jgi:regulator of cell morphogenesis and NO signaling
MPIDPRTPIEALSAEYPGIRRALGRLGVDRLQEGNRTLEELAAAHGLSLPAVLHALDECARHLRSAQDWLNLPRKELVAHIISHHHAYAREELARLGPLLEEAKAEGGPLAADLPQIGHHLANLEKDLLAHFQMEERNLFPAICAMDQGGTAPISLSTPREQLSTMQAEHQAVEELFLNIRMLTADYAIPQEAGPALRGLLLGLRDLEDDLYLHLYLENHLLFPRALPGTFEP